MTFVGWWQIALVLALVVVTAIPMSGLIASVYAGKDNFLSPVLRPVERGFYLLAGVDEKREQSWFTFAIATIAFSIAGFVSLYALQRFQNVLPLNPQGFDAVGACWVNPSLRERPWLALGFFAAPLFYAETVLLDYRRIFAGYRDLGVSFWALPFTLVLFPLFRLVDLAGMVKALASTPRSTDKPLASQGTAARGIDV